MKTVAVNKVISENYEMLHILCLQCVILHSVEFYTGCGILHFFRFTLFVANLRFSRVIFPGPKMF